MSIRRRKKKINRINKMWYMGHKLETMYPFVEVGWARFHAFKRLDRKLYKLRLTAQTIY